MEIIFKLYAFHLNILLIHRCVPSQSKMIVNIYMILIFVEMMMETDLCCLGT